MVKKVIDHVGLGELLAESEEKERNVDKVGLGYHRIVKPKQREHSVRHFFKKKFTFNAISVIRVVTTLRFHFPKVRMTEFNKTISKWWRVCQKVTLT